MKGRQRATSTRRWPGETAAAAGISVATTVASGARPAGAPVEHPGAAEAQRVAVAQAAAAVDALLADEGAVAGEAVVEQRALVADDLDLGVQGGDLLVPLDAQAGCLAASHPELGRALLDDDDPLLARAVAEDEEGPPAAFGLDLRLQLGGAGLRRIGAHVADPTSGGEGVSESTPRASGSGVGSGRIWFAQSSHAARQT